MASLELNKKEKGCFVLLLAIIVLGILDLAVFPPTSTPQSPQSKAMIQARTIGLALQQYAADHGGRYPVGQSSTGVFQQLLFGKYVTDPAIFYYPLPGKLKPDVATLKPENVGWDVTCCVDSTSPNALPVVFLTGYTITYQAGARAVPIKQPTPRTWSEWLSGVTRPVHFTAACYKDMSAKALQNPDPDDSFPNFIPTDFDAKGKDYRQLTPEGQ
jgi:type II secretory pathway pseudopilin PulG